MMTTTTDNKNIQIGRNKLTKEQIKAIRSAKQKLINENQIITK